MFIMSETRAGLPSPCVPTVGPMVRVRQVRVEGLIASLSSVPGAAVISVLIPDASGKSEVFPRYCRCVTR
jgi:hypothetical protein